jgi:hypothetical protein
MLGTKEPQKLYSARNDQTAKATMIGQPKSEIPIVSDRTASSFIIAGTFRVWVRAPEASGPVGKLGRLLDSWLSALTWAESKGNNATRAGLPGDWSNQSIEKKTFLLSSRIRNLEKPRRRLLVAGD